MRTITFRGKDTKIYTLYAEKNKLNGNIMYWFDHNKTMFCRGFYGVIKQIKRNQEIINDVGEV